MAGPLFEKLACAVTSDFTIFGASGFVGGALAIYLRSLGYSVREVGRNNWPEVGASLGNVIFAIGMTAQFRGKSIQTIETQIQTAVDFFKNYQYNSFLYLSSTRVYQSSSSSDEGGSICAVPGDSEYIYNLTKLTAECLCLSFESHRVKVVRLSNVFGSDMGENSFLGSILRDIAMNGDVVIRSSPYSSKDYIHILSACEYIHDIVIGGTKRLYNVASGENVSNREICAELVRCGGQVHFENGAPEISFPRIDISRLVREFPRPQRKLLAFIPELLEAARARYQR